MKDDPTNFATLGKKFAFYEFIYYLALTIGTF